MIVRLTKRKRRKPFGVPLSPNMTQKAEYHEVKCGDIIKFHMKSRGAIPTGNQCIDSRREIVVTGDMKKNNCC